MHRQPALAEEHRRDVGDEPVGEVLGDERAVQPSAAFDHRLEHAVALGRAASSTATEVDAAAAGGPAPTISTFAPAACHASTRVAGACSVVMTSVGASVGSKSGPSAGDPAARVEQDPQRLAGDEVVQPAHGQPRPIGTRGAGTDHDAWDSARAGARRHAPRRR